MSHKIRLATAWLGGCSGCHMSFLDLDEKLFELEEKAELVYSPIADVKEFPPDVDVTLVEGAVANVDHLELARDIRANSKVVVSFGDCAVTGNVTSLRNRLGVDDLLNGVYREGPGSVPRRTRSCGRIAHRERGPGAARCVRRAPRSGHRGAAAP